MNVRQIESTNKKVKNATSTVYDHIKFKSQLELMVYKTLVSEGFEPKYERVVYDVLPPQPVTVPLFTKNKFSTRYKAIQPISANTCIDRRTLKRSIYTPDFVFDYNGKRIIVEVKGFATDTFKYRFRQFRTYLESRPDKDNIELWEIFTKTQLLDCIRHLKAEVNN